MESKHFVPTAVWTLWPASTGAACAKAKHDNAMMMDEKYMANCS